MNLALGTSEVAGKSRAFFKIKYNQDIPFTWVNDTNNVKLKNQALNTHYYTIIPNPTRNKLVELRTEIPVTVNEIRITDISGRVQPNIKMPILSTFNQIQLNLEGYNPGLYLINIYLANGEFECCKLIIE